MTSANVTRPAAVLALALLLSPSAQALEAYSGEQTRQFMDWCTGKASNSETACTCTLKRLATTVPPAALTAFLADKSGGGSGFSMSTATVATAALVTDSLTACLK